MTPTVEGEGGAVGPLAEIGRELLHGEAPGKFEVSGAEALLEQSGKLGG